MEQNENKFVNEMVGTESVTEIVGAEVSDTEITPEVLEKKSKKKLFILGGIGAAVVIIAVVVAVVLRGSVFERIRDELLDEYPSIISNVKCEDGKSLIIDTNPYDKEYDEMTTTQQDTFYLNQIYSELAIEFVNEKLGFSSSLYNKMEETSAMMGRQSEENGKYSVSWTFHPSRGLKVIYEKK